MPLGNGRFGAAIWSTNRLTVQLNRADTLPDRWASGLAFGSLTAISVQGRGVFAVVTDPLIVTLSFKLYEHGHFLIIDVGVLHLTHQIEMPDRGSSNRLLSRKHFILAREIRCE